MQQIYPSSLQKIIVGFKVQILITKLALTLYHYLLLILNTIIFLLISIHAYGVVTEKMSQYLGAFLILCGVINGVFCALDLLLFYIFFEVTLIPMFILIGIWGGP